MTSPINCACLIHGDKYDFDYVNKLYSQLTRAFSVPVVLHVFCEESREIPESYIKHSLVDWNLTGSNQAWWYKIQLFDRRHFDGPVVYFDLDIVVTGALDWIVNLPLDYFWSIQDFRYLWRPSSTMMNSSVMYWDASRFWSVFDEFSVARATALHRGDQEYLSTIIRPPLLKFFDHRSVVSWRWQAVAGGYDFVHRRHHDESQSAWIPDTVSLLVFHGDPKPHEVTDPIVVNNWR